MATITMYYCDQCDFGVSVFHRCNYESMMSPHEGKGDYFCIKCKKSVKMGEDESNCPICGSDEIIGRKENMKCPKCKTGSIVFDPKGQVWI